MRRRSRHRQIEPFRSRVPHGLLEAERCGLWVGKRTRDCPRLGRDERHERNRFSVVCDEDDVMERVVRQLVCPVRPAGRDVCNDRLGFQVDDFHKTLGVADPELLFAFLIVPFIIVC